MRVIAKFLPVLALLFLFPAASPESLSGAGGALYSEWSAKSVAAEVSPVPVPVPVRYGSFTVSRPQSELFIGGLAARWRAELSDLASAEQFEEFALRRFRAEIATDGGSADIGDWLAARGEASRDHLLTGSADYLTSYLTGLAERIASGLPFVRNVEWDYQSPLGERRWSTGLSALGALREGGDDAVVWQMRAFAAEESAKGANAGLIYRRVAGDGLIGVNTFLDYESSGDYDKAFWRGSLGGEYRSGIVNVYLNRYFGITDGVQREDGGWIYTRDGADAELDIQIAHLPLGGFSGGVTYYRWEGEYGDEDDKGFRYHLQLQPAGLGARLRLRLELDSPDDGSVDWGGAVLYSYLFDAPALSAAAAAASGFDPRAHFFDPVRREYSQRIVRSGGSGVLINYGWVAGTSYVSPVGADVAIVTLTAAADGWNFLRPHTITAATEAASTLRVATNTAGEEGWAVSVRQLGTVVFTVEDRTNISIAAGTIAIQQTGSDIGTVRVTTAEIALLGTTLEIGLNSAGDEIFIELEEGGIEAVVPYGDISVLVAHGGKTVTVTAGFAAGIRAEIRIVDGAITAMSEEQLPIDTVRSRYEWVAGTSYVSPVGADAVTLTAAADARDFPRPHTITAATEAVSTLRVASERAGWAVSVYQSGRVIFTAGDRTNISIVAGTITVQQSGSDIGAVRLAAAEITLRGAALEIGLNSGGDEIFIELEEGGVDAVVPYGDIRVLAAHGGETVTVVAGVVAGIRAEIRIVNGAITVISEEELPIGAVRSRYEWVAGTSYVSPVGADAATLTAAADARDFPRPHTITAATEAVSTLRVASERAGWAVSVYQSGTVVFTAEDRTNISIVAGTITVQQSGSDIGAVHLAAAEIALRGAALEIGLNSGGDEIFIELEEGGVDAVVPYGDIRVLAAHGGETVTVVAGVVAGIRAEIRIVNGAITVISEEELPIGTVRSRYEWVAGTSYVSPVGADAATLTAAADARDFPRPHTITAATEAVSTLRVASERAGWAVSVYQSGTVVFTAEDRTNISIVAGTITVQQSGSDIGAVRLAAAEITLLGAALEIGLNSGGDEIFIELEEGGIDTFVPYGDIRVLAAHGGETVTVVAGVVAGIRAEIRIVNGAITVMLEEELPIGAVRSRYEWVAGTSYVSPVGADAVTLTAAADARDFPRPHTITAATEAVSTLRVASERAGWAVSVYQSGAVVFTAEDRTNISIVAGTITVQQSGSDIGAVRLAAAEITLLGAALEIGLNSGGDEIFIELEEGGIDTFVPYGDIRVLAAHGGETVTVVAGVVAGIRAEIRIVNGAITVMLEQPPIDIDSIRSRIVVVGGISGGFSFHNNVWSSTGAGVSLTLAELDDFPTRIIGPALAELGGTLYLSGGLDGRNEIVNSVWRSVDGGASWESVGTFSPDGRYLHSMVSYNDKLYIIGGLLSYNRFDSSGEVLSSSDGVNWEPAGTIETTLALGTGGFGRAAVVHNNTLFIIGGTTDRNVGFTDSFAIDKDGTIHTLTVSNNLPAYYYASAVSFKGTIYRIGGAENSTPQNEIWSSVDGENWTRLEDFPENISAHQALVFWEGIYVLGGYGNRGYNRVWYSTNATDWEEVSDMPGARYWHAATVYPHPSPISHDLSLRQGGKGQGGTSRNATAKCRQSVMALLVCLAERNSP